MTRQTSAPLTHHALHASPRQAREVARFAADGTYDLNPPYQRGSRWSEDQRVALVRSWHTGIPVPAILANDRCTDAWRKATGTDPLRAGQGMYAVVDGKQRLMTAMAWFAGDLLVPASWFDPEEIETTTDTDDGPYVGFTGLTLTGQRRFTNRAMLPLIEAKVSTVQAEADLYLLINGGGTPQSEADMANAARYASPGA